MRLEYRASIKQGNTQRVMRPKEASLEGLSLAKSGTVLSSDSGTVDLIGGEGIVIHPPPNSSTYHYRYKGTTVSCIHRLLSFSWLCYIIVQFISTHNNSQVVAEGKFCMVQYHQTLWQKQVIVWKGWEKLTQLHWWWESRWLLQE